MPGGGWPKGKTREEILRERPRCPEGHGPEHVNKASKTGLRQVEGMQAWYCFLCASRFRTYGDITRDQQELGGWKWSACPRCDSNNIEKDVDGTWLCWSCDWFEK